MERGGIGVWTHTVVTHYGEVDNRSRREPRAGEDLKQKKLSRKQRQGI